MSSTVRWLERGALVVFVACAIPLACGGHPNPTSSAAAGRWSNTPTAAGRTPSRPPFAMAPVQHRKPAPAIQPHRSTMPANPTFRTLARPTNDSAAATIARLSTPRPSSMETIECEKVPGQAGAYRRTAAPALDAHPGPSAPVSAE